MSSLCRLCRQNLEVEAALNLFEPANAKLLIEIELLTRLTLTYDKYLPKYICVSCRQDLQTATDFRRVCLETQDYFDQNPHVNNKVKYQVNIKKEEKLIYSEDDGDADAQSQCSSEDFLRSDEEAFVEDVEEEPINRDSLSETDDDDEQSAVGNDEIVAWQYMCNECGQNFPTKEKVNGHLAKAHRIYNYECEECGLTFGSNFKLKSHNRELHDVQQKYICDHCGKNFKFTGPLNAHLKSIGAPFKYQCTYCDEKFYIQDMLTYHCRRFHKDKQTQERHICHVCGAELATSYNLSVHLKRHTGDKSHKCQQCPYSCRTAAALRCHQRIHDDVYPYSCRYSCGKLFRNCSTRSAHERVHMGTGLRPYKCDYCTQRFVTKFDCKYHQRIHTMNRNYSCDICDQHFKLKKHLNTHLLTKRHKKQESEVKENEIK
ncbi:transcription factor Ouib [Scaptodrosophila lebanonensis]|uniref:Transcription factor Ouib n=1 Tax=Drosophila lebanonensis TaxID=7225 RepID=A0A6J2TFD0_DROLE|nr:transcription factor Ouib [Scaptodrosophila lebanonensis]